MTLENIPLDTLIGGTALILSIIGIYYACKSVRSPILLEACRKHTQELIEFLKEWYDEFPRYESATTPPITSIPSTSITHHKFPNIETNWKYQDLIQYHLPDEYKTLPTKLEEYKKLVNEYEIIRYQLYEKIKKDVLAKTCLKYDPNWSEEHGVSQHFVTRIYQQSVSWIRDKRLYSIESSNYKIQNNELWFERSGLAKGTTEERDKAKKVFEELMFKKDYLEEYKIDIVRIIKEERKLEKMHNEIKGMIEKLIGFPILPGTKCEILKNI